jgi:hypothetical protein
MQHWQEIALDTAKERGCSDAYLVGMTLTYERNQDRIDYFESLLSGKNLRDFQVGIMVAESRNLEFVA